MGTDAGQHDTSTLVLFRVGALRLALLLSQVQRVLRSVAITPLPDAPPMVSGIINVEGSVIAVVDVRPRFGLPSQPISTRDQLLIARTNERTVALIADAVDGVRECSVADWVDSGDIAPGLDSVAGVVRFADGLVVIQDLDTFLSMEEERALKDALARHG